MKERTETTTEQETIDTFTFNEPQKEKANEERQETDEVPQRSDKPLWRLHILRLPPHRISPVSIETHLIITPKPQNAKPKFPKTHNSLNKIYTLPFFPRPATMKLIGTPHTHTRIILNSCLKKLNQTHLSEKEDD